MKFTTKVYVTVGSILVLMSISVVILLNLLEKSMVQMHVVVNDLYERTDIAQTIKFESANIGREFREIMDASTNESVTSSVNAWDASNLEIRQNIESLKEKDTQEKTHELIENYTALHDSYLNKVQRIISLKRVDHNVKIPDVQINDVKLTRERMIQVSEILLGLQEQEMKNELLRSQESYNWAVSTIYIYLIISLGLGVGIIIFVIRSMTKNLRKVTAVMESVNDSNMDDLPRVAVSSKDEIGSIATAFNKMVSELEAHNKFEKHLLEQAEEQSWLKTKIAEIATMYPEAKDIEMLAQLLISRLVPMVGASFGVFYMKSNSGVQVFYKRIAGYAYSDNYKGSEGFYLGEGLVGQCAFDKQVITLSEVPVNYINIRSGTGEGSPSHLMILPVMHEGEVLSVIEIASFDSFSSGQVMLLEEIVGSIGITINSILNHMKAEQLLQESQTLTEELQVQSEELQLQQEELRTTNEKLEEQYTASEQKKKELEKVREALEEKAQQLEISSQYKSEFLANMSHELRTPLNSLLILAQILSENDGGNLTDKQQEYIRTIHTAGNDLLLLINDILDLAKVEAGKFDVVSKEIDLHDVKDTMIKQFSPIANQKNISFTIDLDSHAPQRVVTDQQRLQQVLKNLLSNAFKFTESGSVSLEVRQVWKEKAERMEQADYMLAFSVIDTGIGIPIEKQDVIFDAFKQADGTTSRKYGGTGLGLSISREISHALGGFIELTSRVNEGSNFTLYLPIKQSSLTIERNSYIEEAAANLDLELENRPLYSETIVDEDGSSLDLGKSALRHKKVLIVDDDIRNVYALTIALEQFEMDIIVAENGREGIEMLQGNPNTDIILMDIMMPEMDGFEAIRRIRELPKYKALPIIALTAKAMKQSREECLEAGATDYISKPIDLDQLYSLMHVWLYRKEG